MLNKNYYIVFILSFFLALSACKKDENTPALRNDLIKKSMGPNLVGSKIWFSYAMGTTIGKLSSAEALASIAGASGTGFEASSWNTSTAGAEVSVVVAKDLATTGSSSTANFIDTIAATLRYYYVVPEKARGKRVSFSFSAKSSNGESTSFSAGEYAISNMDMIRNIVVTDNAACYLSIKDLKAYTKAEIDANASLASNIDLVYVYRVKTGVNFGHALVSPAATSYLEGAAVPSGASSSTKIDKQVNIRDQQLSDKQYAVFIDDLDFEQLNIDRASNFVLNFKADEGAWIVTADGTYRAYIYINSIDNAGKKMTISIKRYKVK